MRPLNLVLMVVYIFLPLFEHQTEDTLDFNYTKNFHSIRFLSFQSINSYSIQFNITNKTFSRKLTRVQGSTITRLFKSRDKGIDRLRKNVLENYVIAVIVRTQMLSPKFKKHILSKDIHSLVSDLNLDWRMTVHQIFLF